jgi:hypothetical protein
MPSEQVHDQADGHCCGSSELDCSLTVNDVLARHPATGTVFNRFGVDLCCSASLTVEDAALALGLNRHALCGALREAAAAA